MSDKGPVAATPRVAAGIVVVHDNAIALVRTTYKEFWDIPGGYVEPGESPLTACAREVKEELGLDAGELSLVAIDWAPNDSEGDKLLFLFRSDTIGPTQLESARFLDGEIAEVRLVPIGELENYTITRLAKRLVAATEALRAGLTPVYLEHGAVVGQ